VSGFLGGGYPLIGRVVRGEGRGRELGFPTANLGLEETAKLMPPDGVYAAWVYLPERHGAVFNLGYRPTFKGKSRSLEVHLFDFEGDLYGKTLRLAMCRRLRAERRFENRRALTEQIQRDLDAARQALSQTDGTL
jgi:riboflavin kinase/FMN adenylyltransferase